MKRFISLLALVAIGTMLTASAQKATNTLVGVWQQEQTVQEGGKTRTIHLPVWKVITADGTFYTFLIASRNGRSMKMNEGTYTLNSDSVMTEHVHRSLTAPELDGCDNAIRYRFVDANTIQIVYRMPDALKDGHETWRRVTMEKP